MDVNINIIEESIKAIEAESDRHYLDMFQKASNGRIILKSDLESYEQLLQNLAIAQKYVEYRRENEEVINGYLRLQEQIDTMNIPNVTEETKTDEKSEKDMEAPVVSSEEMTLENKTEEEVPEEKPEEEPAKVEEKPIINEVNESPIIESAADLGVFADNLIDDEYGYRLKKGEIIQDMAINDKSEQVFKTPGMTDEEIKNSQELLKATEMPIQEPIVDDSSYKAMTDEEVQESQEKLESVPVTNEYNVLPTDESTVEANEPEITEQPSVRHKVVKKQIYTWKNKIAKKFAFLKGLVFCEEDASREYLEISAKIANLRAKYKTKSVVENNIEFSQIEESITNSVALAEDEKKRLYQKLSRLGKKLEKLNHQNQEQLENAADNLFEVDGPAAVLG